MLVSCRPRPFLAARPLTEAGRKTCCWQLWLLCVTQLACSPIPCMVGPEPSSSKKLASGLISLITMAVVATRQTLLRWMNGVTRRASRPSHCHTAQRSRQRLGQRCHQTDTRIPEQQNSDTAIYIASTSVFVLGFAYASVPLYRAFCQVFAAAFAILWACLVSSCCAQATGYGGTVNKHDQDRLKVGCDL